MRLVGVDAGGETGVFFLDTELNDRKEISVKGPEIRQVLEIFGILQNLKPDILIIEDFLLSGRNVSTTSRVGLSSARIGFGIQLLCSAFMPHAEDRMKIVLQLPGNAKIHMPDQRLRDVGFWSKNQHVRDAMRHVLAYCRKNGVKLSVV